MSHKSFEELEKELAIGKKQIVIGGVYSHYKNPNNHYKVHSLAIQEASNNVCVIYEALYMPGIMFVRDLDNWLKKVEVEGEMIQRFSLISS